ncbi:arginase [Holotrichia oblita]|nr:arginase [Holotrichia oblita]
MKAKTEDLAVLWVDAHADLNTNRSSQSGNIHGMPLAVLAKELDYYWPPLPGADWLKCKLSLRNLAYIGLRSLDPYEHVIMHNLGIAHFDMFDIQRYGIDAVVSAALDKMDPDHNKPIHVSFDIDSLDPLEAPSTGTPVRGGLLLREGIHIMTAIYKTGRLGALDLVEVNPKIGNQSDVDRTVTAAMHIILAAFGQNRRLVKPESNDLIPPNNNK